MSRISYDGRQNKKESVSEPLSSSLDPSNSAGKSRRGSSLSRSSNINQDPMNIYTYRYAFSNESGHDDMNVLEHKLHPVSGTHGAEAESRVRRSSKRDERSSSMVKKKIPLTNAEQNFSSTNKEKDEEEEVVEKEQHHVEEEIIMSEKEHPKSLGLQESIRQSDLSIKGLRGGSNLSQFVINEEQEHELDDSNDHNGILHQSPTKRIVAYISSPFKSRALRQGYRAQPNINDEEIMEEDSIAKSSSDHQIRSGSNEQQRPRGMTHDSKIEFVSVNDFKPYFVRTVIVVCTIAFCIEIMINDGFEAFKFNPSIGPSSQTLILLGAKRSNLIRKGEWWRIFTPILLHAGVIHFVINMLAVFQIGRTLEREFGHWKVASIFICSGIMGNLVSAIFDEVNTSVGASGAIFGLLGAGWGDLIQNWEVFGNQAWRTFLQYSVQTMVNLLIGFIPFIDNFAHLAGFITGVLLGLFHLPKRRYEFSGKKKSLDKFHACMKYSSLVLFISMAIGFTSLFLSNKDIETVCPGCKYVSCIELPIGADEKWWECNPCVLVGTKAFLRQGGLVDIACPQGHNVTIVRTTERQITQEVLLTLCVENCH